MTGLTVVYGCLCSDANDDPDVVPKVCPGHGQPRTGEWANTRSGGVRPGHDCSVHPCPGGER